ncbi:MAG TPA: hypothetical protein DHV93_05990 [Holophagaceae bacterium]|nr:hypothetical protein [Holophagaceae bacterium]
MIRFLRVLDTVALVLGFVLILPGLLGLLLLLGSSQIAALIVTLEQRRHDLALYPHDLAPDSEPR